MTKKTKADNKKTLSPHKDIRVMLKKYNNIDSLLQICQNQLINIQSQKDICIQSQYLQAALLSDMPKTPKDSEKKKKLNIPIEADPEYRRLLNEELFILRDIGNLKSLKTNVDLALSCLNDDERAIIKAYYWGGNSLEKIAKSADPPVSFQYVAKLKNKALAKMQETIK